MKQSKYGYYVTEYTYFSPVQKIDQGKIVFPKQNVGKIHTAKIFTHGNDFIKPLFSTFFQNIE